MFTGIIEELGRLQAIRWHGNGAQFHIQASIVLEDIKVGDSLSLNGCCLTVISKQRDLWSCDVVEETIQRTTLKELKVGDRVNLERAVRYQDRLGGHLVQGHIDEIGRIVKKRSLSDGSWWLDITASSEILRYVVYKGPIAVDGISLTITHVEETFFSFAVIPHTAQTTTLGFKQEGDYVNVEVDLMAKYIDRLNQKKIYASS